MEKLTDEYFGTDEKGLKAKETYEKRGYEGMMADVKTQREKSFAVYYKLHKKETKHEINQRLVGSGIENFNEDVSITTNKKCKTPQEVMKMLQIDLPTTTLIDTIGILQDRGLFKAIEKEYKCYDCDEFLYKFEDVET